MSKKKIIKFCNLSNNTLQNTSCILVRHHGIGIVFLNLKNFKASRKLRRLCFFWSRLNQYNFNQKNRLKGQAHKKGHRIFGDVVGRSQNGF